MKTKPLIFLPLILVSLAAPLFMTRSVSAAQNGEWVDAATIKVGGDTYTDDKVNDSRDYHLGGGNGCTNWIHDFSSDNTHAAFTNQQKDGNDNCHVSEEKGGISLSVPGNAQIYFTWTSANTITAVWKEYNVSLDNGRNRTLKDTVYTLDDVTHDFYTNGGGSKCNSSIHLKSDTQAVFTVRYNNSTPLGDQCQTSPGKNVAIGAAENKSKPPTAPGGSQGKDNSCESKGALGWILCPVIEILDGVFNWLDTQIQALLEVNKDSYTSPKLYQAWSNIRNIAYIILIPIMLVMVIGTALGSELFSAYTVKKAMPRMAAAILFIALSWYICGFLIGLSNVVGSGVIGLITNPFGLGGQITLADLFNPSVGGAAVQGLATGAIATALVAIPFINGALGLVLLYFLGAVLAIFIGFLVLVIRQLFILALLLASPLAILAWIFPGNDKLWKAWWGSFSKLLIMFPLITGLIGIGRVFAYLISVGGAGGGGLQGGLLNPLLKITAYVVPYLIIPLTFKFAGGAFATLSGMANDRSRGVFDRMKKGRQKQMQHMGHNLKGGNFFRRTSDGRFDKLNEKAQRMAHINKAGFRPSNWRSNLNSAVQDTVAVERKKLMEDPEAINSENYDDLMVVGAVARDRKDMEAGLLAQDKARMETERKNVRDAALERGASKSEADAEGDDAALAIQRYRNAESLQNDVSRLDRLRQKYDTRAFRQVASVQAVAGGTATKDAADALELVVNAAGSDDAVLMNLIADMRKAATSAGRIDQGGASQGVTFNAARELAADLAKAKQADTPEEQAALEKAARDKANKAVRKGVIDAQGPSILLHPSMKPSSMRNLVPEIQDRIRDAIASGDNAKIDREMALVNNIHTSLSQTSPQLAKIFGEQVMLDTQKVSDLNDTQQQALGDVIAVTAQDPPRQIQRALVVNGEVQRDGTGQPMMETVTIQSPPRIIERRETFTVQQLLDARRGSPEYSAFTKDYGSATEAQRRAAGSGPAPGGGAGGGPPTGLPGGPG